MDRGERVGIASGVQICMFFSDGVCPCVRRLVGRGEGGVVR